MKSRVDPWIEKVFRVKGKICGAEKIDVEWIIAPKARIQMLLQNMTYMLFQR